MLQNIIFYDIPAKNKRNAKAAQIYQSNLTKENNLALCLFRLFKNYFSNTLVGYGF